VPKSRGAIRGSFRWYATCGFLAGCLFGLSGCMLTEANSVDPQFAGSMKTPAGIGLRPKPLSEMPGSRVREGE